MKIITVSRVSASGFLSSIVLCSLFLSLIPQAVFAGGEEPLSVRTGPFEIIKPGSDAQGSASYSIPIVVPPGRNGIQPTLGLSYSSSSTDSTSAFGYGWNVGVPAITRVNKEGINKLYTQSDFASSLDGELVYISGTTVKTYGAKYESGSYNTYTFDTVNNRWTVTDKSGTVFSFGTTVASRQDNPAILSQIYSWNLDRVEDTNGNYQTFTYFKDAGQVYLDKISYTGNVGVATQFEVSFIREARSDIIPSFRTGFSVKSNFRVKQILVKAMGQWVRKYDLGYTTGLNNARSLLTSVTESGRDSNGNITSLPPTLLEYQKPTISFTQTSWNFPVPLVEGPVSGDNGTRFADLNGDGLSDLIKASNTARGVWLNNGSGWTQTTLFTIDNSAYFVAEQDFGLRAADVNGDGKDDLIHSFQSTPDTYHPSNYTYKKVFFNNGNAFTLDSSYQIPVTLNFASWYSGTSPDMSPLDVNADGRADVAVGGSAYLFGDGVTSGWKNMTASTVGSGTSSQVGDFNGDGLPDTISDYLFFYNAGYNSSETKSLNYGNGSGLVASTISPPAVMADNQGTDYGVRTADVNGDGLTDIIKSHQQVVNYQYIVTNNLWLNTGTGFQLTSVTIPNDVNFSAFTTNIGYRDSGWRIMDVNGDGMPDIVGSKPVSYPGPGIQYSRLYTNTGVKADILSKVTIPQGGTLSYTYKTSLQYKDGSNTIVNTGAPYPVTVLDTVTTNDGNGNSDTKNYFYEGAFQYFANYNDKQFAGFNIITETDSAGNKTKTYYHQGNTTDTARGEVSDHPAKIGRVYRTERYNTSGNLMSAQVNAWDSAALSSGRFLVTNSRNTTLTYEGDASHKDTATTYTYDVNGNVLTKSEYGEVTANTDGTFTDVGSDARTTNYTYANDTSGKVRNKVSQEQLNDAADELVSQSQYLYDSLPLGSVSKGNVTSVKKYISPGVYATSTIAYDTIGLPTATTNPRGYTTTLTYDSYRIYPYSEKNALNHTIYKTWNYAFGKEKTLTDQNSQVTQTDYDGLGRIVSVSATDPYSGLIAPLTQTTYYDYRNAFSDYTQKYITDSVTNDTFNYYDGLGRVIQKKAAHEKGEFATADTTYTRDGLVKTQSLPYYTDSSAKTSAISSGKLVTSFNYDSLNRVTSSTNVVGTTATMYGDWSRTVVDALGNKKQVFTDAFGNISQVNEFLSPETPSPTRYEYNAQNLLTKITDPQDNIRNFSYNARGLRISAEDLHRPEQTQFATTVNTYDNNGNVLTEVRGDNTTTYTYDSLDRVLTENSDTTANVDVAYTYDNTAQTAYGKGRLTSARRLADASNSNWTYLYYLRNGQISQESKSIFGGGSFLTKYSYDKAGNITLLTNPDNSVVKYSYNNLGKVEKIDRKEPSDATYTPVVFNFDYGPHGNVVYKKNANMTDTYYTYDGGELYRLKNISTIDPPLEVPEGETAEVKVASVSTTEVSAESSPSAPTVEAVVPDTTTQQSIPAEQAAVEEVEEVEKPTETKTSSAETGNVDSEQSTTETPANSEQKVSETIDNTTATPIESKSESFIEALTNPEEPKTEVELAAEIKDAKENLEELKDELPVLAEDTTPPPAEDLPVTALDGKIAKEDESLRTESSETFVLAQEGDYEIRLTRLYPMPINVKDEETGEWKEVEKEFTESNGEISVDKGDFSLDVPTDGKGDELATISVGDLKVELATNKSETSITTEGEIVENGSAPDTTAEVKDAVAKDINVSLEVDSSKISKNVIIENIEALKGLTKVDDYYEIPFDLGVPKGTKLFIDGVEIKEATVADRAELRLTKGDAVDSLFIMPGQAHDSQMGKSAVQFAFSIREEEIKMTKRIPAEWLESATFPVITDAVFSASADITDGAVGVNGSSWATMRTATTGNFIGSTDVFGVEAWQQNRISRMFLSFNTAALPDTAEIQKAVIKLFTNGAYDSYMWHADAYTVVTGTTKATPQQLALGDYSKVQSVELSDQKTFAEIKGIYNSSPTNRFVSYTLNTAGIAKVSKTGWSQFGLRSGFDVKGTVPPNIYYAMFKFTESPGTTQDPYLEITYRVLTLPARAMSLTVDGYPNNTSVKSALPKFTGVYNDTDETDTALAYQIQVIKDTGTLTPSWTTPLWDSGKKYFTTPLAQGARSENLTYAGAPLPIDGQKYLWRMRVWDVGEYEGPYSSGKDYFVMSSAPQQQFDLHTDCISAQKGRLDPSGIKCAAPVFSAKYTSDPVVNKYRLQVSSDPDFLDPSKLTWDTGAPESPEDPAIFLPMKSITKNERTDDIIYTGLPLKFDGTRYYWRIMYKDVNGTESPWSAVATFTTFTSKVFQNIAYTYDVVGNVTRVREGSDTVSAKVATYMYDPLYRLTGASAVDATGGSLYDHVYEYDAIGNMTFSTDVGAYSYDSENHPHAAGMFGWYDTRGNKIQDGDKLMQYSYDNLINKVNHESKETTYTYDAQKSRVTVTARNDEGTSITTYYPNKTFNKDSNGKIIKHIFAGTESVATIQTLSGIVTPFFTHNDALGSSTVTTSGTHDNPPSITLKGKAQETVVINTTYIDPGATAEDAEQGVLTVATTGSVNTTTLGSYILTYTVTDNKGQSATVNRTVTVVPGNFLDPIPDPTILWKFNGESTNPINKLANTYSGYSLTNSKPIQSDVDKNGAVDGSLKLDGNANVVSTSSFSPGVSDFSFGARVKFNSMAGAEYLVASADPTQSNIPRYVLLRNGASVQCFLYDQYTYQATFSTGAPLTPNTWYDFVCTRKGNTVALYVNGVPQFPGYGNQTNLNFTKPLVVGGMLNSSGLEGPFNGLVDEVKIWSYALTPNQAQQAFEDLANRPPTLSLNGKQFEVIAQDSTYTDPGATASDVLNGVVSNLTSQISIIGSINTATLGTQTLTYTITDSGNLTATQTRSVTIVPADLAIPRVIEAQDYMPYGKVRNSEQDQTPTTQTENFQEQKKFTGYEYDQSSDLSYANARYYNQNVGMFTSPDPAVLAVGGNSKLTQLLLSDPQQQNAYSYARNNPLKYKDPTGLLSIIIPGTNYETSAWNMNGGAAQSFINGVSSALGENRSTMVVNSKSVWSGDNTDAARQQAASQIIDYVNNYSFADGEQLNIIGHSHGGTIGIMVANGVNRKVDTLLTLGTPVRDKNAVDGSKVGRHINGYSWIDPIQSRGGTNYFFYTGSFPSFLNDALFAARYAFSSSFEMGTAGRTYNGAQNVNLTLQSISLTPHTGLWNNPSSQQKLQTTIKNK
jgi:RHS repeat-associated protein